MTGDLGGVGNTDVNPQFVAGAYLSQTASGQSSTSPCVDASDPYSALLAGSTRTDGYPDMGVVDVGYHSAGPACLGDVNLDGVRNFLDFTVLAGAYGAQLGQAHYSPFADLNGDAWINFQDLSVFTANYGAECP
jgi:hypothetical protein